jgi:hypothetical protein
MNNTRLGNIIPLSFRGKTLDHAILPGRRAVVNYPMPVIKVRLAS